MAFALALLSAVAPACRLDTRPIFTSSEPGTRDGGVGSTVDTVSIHDAGRDVHADDDGAVSDVDPEDGGAIQVGTSVCMTAADCQMPESDCYFASCYEGQCALAGRPVGTPCGQGGVCTDRGVCRECEPGQTMCADDGSARSCGNGGQWSELQHCSTGCLSGRCADCTPGTTQCNGDTRRVCDDDGRWEPASACLACTDQGCGECKAGASECTADASGARTCDGTGHWAAAVSCDSGCAQGRCNACRPGALRCADGQAQTCAADGTWDTGMACGAPGCAGDHCGVCMPNASECVGKGRHTCGADGQWGATSDCPSTCSNGACDACTPGAKRCTEDQGVETCGSDMQWGQAMACASGCDGDRCAECRDGSVQCPSNTSVKVCENKKWGDTASCRPNSRCNTTPQNGNTCPCNAGFRDPHPNPGLCM